MINKLDLIVIYDILKSHLFNLVLAWFIDYLNYSLNDTTITIKGHLGHKCLTNSEESSVSVGQAICLCLPLLVFLNPLYHVSPFPSRSCPWPKMRQSL